ncbi:SO2930 family diheme c-type cytochrome [Pseudoxanthomonas sp.]|uniref:SO2930 family diheme c-type cytochrome n=1 Tax=Pseudoxanthomonas sp. TaxID=1871049 RepID=UPI0028C3C54B|nr:SO2930 family diheme c-type cytochrome [Pseudoxanthomonas sp.]
MTRAILVSLLGVSLALLASCRNSAPVHYFAEGQPASLDDWGLLRIEGGALRPNEGVLPYDLATPLFSDYAHKLRTVWMPAGQAARYHGTDAFEFPVGTIISKTFYYPLPEAGGWDGKSVARTPPTASPRGGTLDLRKVRLIETRLLVHRPEGWIALPYVWNDAQTGATLKRTGALVPLELVGAGGARATVQYQVPDQNQCGGCHITDNRSRRFLPIGPKARYLNRDFDYADGRENQLARWTRAGYLAGAPAATAAPRAVEVSDTHASLDARARAYLDINCGHCHSATGPAVTSGLHLDAMPATRLQNGFCKQPVAAGKGTGDRLYDIEPGHADGSVLLFRMDSDDPAVMMPELGRSVVHREGVELIRQWIDAQQGRCDAALQVSGHPSPTG